MAQSSNSFHQTKTVVIATKKRHQLSILFRTKTDLTSGKATLVSVDKFSWTYISI